MCLIFATPFRDRVPFLWIFNAHQARSFAVRLSLQAFVASVLMSAQKDATHLLRMCMRSAYFVIAERSGLLLGMIPDSRGQSEQPCAFLTAPSIGQTMLSNISQLWERHKHSHLFEVVPNEAASGRPSNPNTAK
jgi:hypothetical protein